VCLRVCFCVCVCVFVCVWRVKEARQRAEMLGQCRHIFNLIFSFFNRRVEEARQRAEMLGQRLRDEMTRFKKAKVMSMYIMYRERERERGRENPQ